MRVLVTRAHTDAERTARELAARGHEAVLAPVLRIARTDALPPPGPFDAILLTSANAVPALASLDPATAVAPVFTVGERTGSAAAAAGFHDVRSANGDASSLADLITRAMRPQGRLLHIAGVNRKPELESLLPGAGFALVTWVAYEALAADRLPEAGAQALRDGRLDAALHYSRRSTSVVLELIDRAALADEFKALAHVCLSPDTAAPLHANGAGLVRVAAFPDENALLTALDECAETDDQTGSRATR
jgi:uroporphyrinogen-III synthase